jgi:hypothetical protein
MFDCHQCPLPAGEMRCSLHRKPMRRGYVPRLRRRDLSRAGLSDAWRNLLTARQLRLRRLRWGERRLRQSFSTLRGRHVGFVRVGSGKLLPLRLRSCRAAFALRNRERSLRDLRHPARLSRHLGHMPGDAAVFLHSGRHCRNRLPRLRFFHLCDGSGSRSALPITRTAANAECPGRRSFRTGTALSPWLSTTGRDLRVTWWWSTPDHKKEAVPKFPVANPRSLP